MFLGEKYLLHLLLLVSQSFYRRPGLGQNITLSLLKSGCHAVLLIL